MSKNILSLATIFDGWDGYQTSLVHAIQPLAQQHLAWRPEQEFRSVGEVASHIALGRVGWFARMLAPGSRELEEMAEKQEARAVIHKDKEEVIRWLEMSWQMIDNTLNQWTVQDLSRTYRHEYQGKVYSVTYQWTIWRILTHDIHHGGELALMLGQLGLKVPELGDLFGHLTEPALAVA